MTSEILATMAWRLDALEMLAERAHEKLVDSENGEAQRIVSVMTCIIEEIQRELHGEE